MKINLVFDRWIPDYNKEVDQEAIIEASMGNYHPGTCFEAEIELSEDNKVDLLKGMNKGLKPVFQLHVRTKRGN